MTKSYIDDLPRIPVKALETGANLAEDDFSAPTPYVVRGLVRDWPMVRAGQQSPAAVRDYLLNFYNQQPVMVSHGPAENQGRIFYKDDMSLNVTNQKSDMRQVFDQIAAVEGQAEQPCLYVAATAIESVFPGLQAQNPIDLGGRSAFGRIWLGTRTRIAPHNDSQSNLACVVAGRRRFIVFPPQAFRDLYLGPTDNTPAGRTISMVDVINPDFETHPRFRKALESAAVAELEPGDALYMPPLWWHHVDGLEPFNILINYWWRQPPSVFGLPEPALDHAILAFRDRSEAERAYWRDIFDYYVFNAGEDTTAHIPESKRGILGKITPDVAKKLRTKLMRYFQR
ncbi:MAG: cupin-like domain-containing protein [Pseudomonadota bacterium]